MTETLSAGETPRDVGDWAAEQALAAVQESLVALELDVPRDIFRIGGTGFPIQDVCDGQLFAHITAAFPTDGSGVPYQQARPDELVPAWAWVLHVGFLWCRTVIDAEGAAVDPEQETIYARRDSDYRLALLDGLYGRWAPAIIPCVLGIRWGQWAPIGPDGGVSGGFVEITLISGFLAVSGPC